MRSLLSPDYFSRFIFASYGGRVNDVHLYDVGERNGPHANASDNNAKCAYAQYLDGRDRVADMVQQTDHLYIHCAAVAHSYNHTDYNRASCNTEGSLHSCYGRDHYTIRCHDRGHVRG